jgi:hypothetical protein
MAIWLSRFARLRKVTDRYSSEPYLRGRAAQVAGVALVADGLIGLQNPLQPRNKRPGIVGAVLVAAIGALFILVGGLLQHSVGPYPGGQIAQGTITEVTRQVGTTAGNHNAECAATIRYQVRGQVYTVTPGESSTSLCSQQGDTINVSYLPDRPAAGRPQFSGDSVWVGLVPIVGWVVLVSGVLLTVSRIAELLVGSWLLLRGHRLVSRNRAVPVELIVQELQQAWTGTCGPGDKLVT